MKGGLEIYAAVIMLVFTGMIVIALLGGTFIRAVTIGPPLQVTTYTEYRWMNYLPSSAIFALTYSPAGESQAWQALNKLALYDAGSTSIIVKHSELSGSFSGIEGLTSGDLEALDNRLKVLEDSFNDGSSIKREFTIVKDSSGVMLVYGMDQTITEFKAGHLASIAFPEDYPYKCSQKQVPVFSKDKDNMRIQMVICCQGIKRCADYLSVAGSNDCSADDVCGVGPCRIIQPSSGERQCVENYPPSVGITLVSLDGKALISYSFKAADQVNFKIDVKEDSAIKQAAIDYGDGKSEPIEPKDFKDAIDPDSPGGKLKEVTMYHPYDKSGDHLVTCKVWDDANNMGTGTIKVIVAAK